ncbi:hypothetical protein ACWGLF_09455 [Streptomyces puniciscabiei]
MRNNPKVTQDLHAQVSTIGPIKPVARSLSPARRELAEGLRSLFSCLDISIRRYAVRIHQDPSVVSRFLSGHRLASASFVTGLIHEAHKAHVPLSTDDASHLRHLLQKALEEQPGDASRIEQLYLQLDYKDSEICATRKKSEELEKQIALKRKQISSLRANMRSLEASHHSERDRAAEAVAKLRFETDELQEKLRREQERARKAEEDCRRLEIEIAQLEAKIDTEKQQMIQHDKEGRKETAARIRDLQKEVSKRRSDLAYTRIGSAHPFEAYVGPDASECGV